MRELAELVFGEGVKYAQQSMRDRHMAEGQYEWLTLVTLSCDSNIYMTSDEMWHLHDSVN